jgi:hypothetical protein
MDAPSAISARVRCDLASIRRFSPQNTSYLMQLRDSRPLAEILIHRRRAETLQRLAKDLQTLAPRVRVSQRQKAVRDLAARCFLLSRESRNFRVESKLMERAIRKPYLTTLLLPFLPKTDIDTRAKTAASTYKDFMNADKRLARATSTRGHSLMTRTQHPSSSTTGQAGADADMERER